jgi:hypothetical protein
MVTVVVSRLLGLSCTFNLKVKLDGKQQLANVRPPMIAMRQQCTPENGGITSPTMCYSWLCSCSSVFRNNSPQDYTIPVWDRLDFDSECSPVRRFCLYPPLLPVTENSLIRASAVRERLTTDQESKIIHIRVLRLVLRQQHLLIPPVRKRTSEISWNSR